MLSGRNRVRTEPLKTAFESRNFKQAELWCCRQKGEGGLVSRFGSLRKAQEEYPRPVEAHADQPAERIDPQLAVDSRGGHEVVAQLLLAVLEFQIVLECSWSLDNNFAVNRILPSAAEDRPLVFSNGINAKPAQNRGQSALDANSEVLFCLSAGPPGVLQDRSC